MMWLIIGIIALSVFSTAAMLLFPKSIGGPSPDPASLEDFTFPTNDEGRAIPRIYGTCRIHPLIAHFKLMEYPSDYNAFGLDYKIKSDGTTIGYRYFADILYVMGGDIDSFVEFRIDDKIKATPDGSGEFTALTGPAADINGYSKPSTLYWSDGSHVSVPWTSLSDSTGDEIGYRGMALMWGPHIHIGDNVRNVPNYSCILRHQPRLVFGDSSVDMSVIGDETNPADILLDWMVNVYRKDISEIDVASFEAAQAVLYDEGLGLSLATNRAKAGEDWIADLMRHIDGHLYQHDSTGLYTLKLVREDYDPDDLATVTDSHVEKCRFSRSLWDQVVSGLVFKYTNDKTFDEASYKLHNPAASNISGKRNVETVSFPFARGAAIGEIILKRIAPRYFRPMPSVRFDIPYKAAESLGVLFHAGDVFKFTSSVLGATYIMRVTKRRTGRNARVLTVEAVEDFFATVDDIGIPDSPELPDYSLVSELTHVVAFDAPKSLSTDRPFEAMVLAGPPASGTATSYRVGDQGDHELDTFGICGYGTIKTGSALSATYLSEEIVIAGAAGVTAFSLTDAQWQSGYRCAIAYTDAETWEAFSVKTCTSLGGGEYRLTGLLRGVTGPGPMAFASGTSIYVLPASTSNSPEFPVVYLSYDVDYFSVRPMNAQNVGPLTQAPWDTEFYSSVPHPVYNVFTNEDGDVEWRYRNRRGGAGDYDVNDWASVDHPPEDDFQIQRVPALNPRNQPVYTRDYIFPNSGVTGRVYTIRQRVVLGSGYQVRTYLSSPVEYTT